MFYTSLLKTDFDLKYLSLGVFETLTSELATQPNLTHLLDSSFKYLDLFVIIILCMHRRALIL